MLLHHTASQIVAEVERHLRDLFGVDAVPLGGSMAATMPGEDVE